MISIVIPTYNEEKNLPRLIEAIKNNKWVKYEIIVVDNGSTDKTKMISLKEGCKFILNPKKTMVGLSRNMGAEAAKGDLIYFIDADWVPQGKDHLKNIEEFFEKNNGTECGEPKVVYRKDTLVKKLVALENEHRLRESRMGAYIYRKSFFKKIGGFGDSLGFGEDKILTQKVHKYSGRIKNSFLLQDLVRDLKSVYKQGKWYGEGFINFFKESKELMPFISALFWTIWIVFIPLSFLSEVFLYLLTANLLVIFLTSIIYFFKSKKLISFAMPAIKIVRSFGELVGLISFLFSRK